MFIHSHHMVQFPMHVHACIYPFCLSSSISHTAYLIRHAVMRDIIHVRATIKTLHFKACVNWLNFHSQYEHVFEFLGFLLTCHQILWTSTQSTLQALIWGLYSSISFLYLSNIYTCIYTGYSCPPSNNLYLFYSDHSFLHKFLMYT